MDQEQDESKASQVPKGTHPADSPENFWHTVRALTPFAIVCLGGLAILYTLYFARDLFLPIFLAAFLSILLKPAVQSLSSIGLNKSVAAIVVLIALVGSIITAIVNLSGPAEEWFDRMPQIQRQIEIKLWSVRKSIQQAKEATEKIKNIADGDTPKENRQEVSIQEKSLLESAFETTWLTLVQVLITVALTFLFLAQNTDETRQRFRSLPWRQYRTYVDDFLESAQKQISRFVRVSAVIYLTLGTLTGIAMYLLGMPNPVLWGAMAFLLGFMPYVGPLLVTASIAVASLLTFENWWQIAAPPLVYLTMTTIEGYFVTPAVLGRQLTLSPVSVFLSMLLWTWLWGMPGAFLSVPIVLIATLFARHLFLVLPKAEPEQTVPVHPQAPAPGVSGAPTA